MEDINFKSIRTHCDLKHFHFKIQIGFLTWMHLFQLKISPNTTKHGLIQNF